MKSHKFGLVLFLLVLNLVYTATASDVFNDLFYFRKNLDSVCGEAKWLVQYSESEGKINLIGYGKGGGRIFSASGTIKPGMQVTDNIGIEIFTSLKITISDTGGLVKNADLFGGECKSLFLTYEYYFNVLKNLQKYHFESGLKNSSRKYLVIEGDPEIVMAADQMNPDVPASHEYLRDRKPPTMGFGYSYDDNGRLMIGEIFEGSAADHAGLIAGDIVTQIFIDYEVVKPEAFKAEMAKENKSILRLVVIRETKPHIVDMYFPSLLERRLMNIPHK